MTYVKVGLVVAALLASFFGAKWGVGSFFCWEKLNGTSVESRYKLAGGCQVKVGGQWVPYDRWRVAE